VRYVRLLDGGLTDNIEGSLVNSPDRQRPSVRPAKSAELSVLFVINVNAKSDATSSIDTDEQGPDS